MARGNNAAVATLGELVKNHHTSLLAHARRHGCTNLADAEDVLGDVLVRITTKLRSGWTPAVHPGAEALASAGPVHQGSLEAYVFVAVRNEALKHARKGTRRREIELEHRAELAPAEASTDTTQAVDLRSELATANRDVVARCTYCSSHPSGLCRVLALLGDGVPEADVAATLNMARPTVRVRKMRCRSKILAALRTGES